MKIKSIAVVLSLLVFTSLAGCNVYKIDIQQGNQLTAEMVSQVETGMTKREVTRVLGFPLINDPFHKDRWDYFYSKHIGSTGQTSQQHVALIFDNGKLKEIIQNIGE